MNSPYSVLLTSLDEIFSFRPCLAGKINILMGQNKTEPDSVQFPILDAMKSNSVSDICWLLGQRQTEIQVAVKFAKLCADSVSHLDNKHSRRAAYAAADAAYAYDDAAYAAYADAYAAADAAYATAAAYAADAADAADAAYAADAAADADAAAAAATQIEKNKQFLILCLSHFNPVTNQVELPS